MATRIHFRYVVQDQLGSAIQNAKVFVYQPGTTTDFTGSAYAAKTGGSPIANGLVTNNQGEADAWFDTPQTIDVRVTDNSGAAYYPAAPAVPITFTLWTEANWDLTIAREDLPTGVGADAGLSDITTGAQTEDAGVSPLWTPIDHVHGHASVFSANPHGVADHTDVTRTIWLPVNDGVVLDAGTLSSRGTLPNTVRTIALPAATTAGALWTHSFDDWASGEISVQIFFVGDTTNSNPVRWELTAKTVAAGSSVVAAGTATPFTGAAVGTLDLLVKEALTSTTITPGANGDLFMLDVRRLGADGADTYTGVAHIIGVLLSYTGTQ